MSVATPPASGGAGGHPIPTAAPPPALETCPLCDTPLDPEQEWCLRCGAAARTRLAASPAWRAPVLTLAVLAALSLGVLAAALVSLAGGSRRATVAPVTTTITTAPTVPAATVAPTTTATPATSTPSAGLHGPNALTRTSTSGAATTPGARSPRTGLTGTTTAPRLKTPGTKAPPRTTPSAAPPTSNPLFTPTPKR